MRHAHGDIIEPEDRFMTYAWEMDVSHEALRAGGLESAERALLTDADVRTRHAAAEIDPDCPVVLTVGTIVKMPSPSPFCERLGVRVRVEFPRYVYDDAKRMAEEWRKEQARQGRL